MGENTYNFRMKLHIYIKYLAVKMFVMFCRARIGNFPYYGLVFNISTFSYMAIVCKQIFVQVNDRLHIRNHGMCRLWY